MESSALKINRKRIENEKFASKSIVSNTPNKKLFKRRAFAVSFLLAAILISRISIFMSLTNSTNEISKINTAITELEKEHQDYIGKIEAIKKSQRIKEDAIYKLGMVIPSPEQIVYVNVDEQTPLQADNIEIFQQIKAVFSLFSGSL